MCVCEVDNVSLLCVCVVVLIKIFWHVLGHVVLCYIVIHRFFVFFYILCLHCHSTVEWVMILAGMHFVFLTSNEYSQEQVEERYRWMLPCSRRRYFITHFRRPLTYHVSIFLSVLQLLRDLGLSSAPGSVFHRCFSMCSVQVVIFSLKVYLLFVGA